MASGDSNSRENTEFNEAERLEERRRLDLTIRELRARLDEFMRENDERIRDMIESQRSMRDTAYPVPQDFDDLVNVWHAIKEIDKIEKNILLIALRIKLLKKMLSSPYFGRIDFLEDDAAAPGDGRRPEMIYIGMAGLQDESGNFLIYDWRAPVSSMYYDYEVGRAEYECPAGTIAGEITLKRQYKIVEGRFAYMFDSNLKIDDEILQEILGRSTNSRMKAIVTSIQREQNRVIRNDRNRVLIVNGPAGSGKTSIVLHKVSYMLYKHRGRTTSQNILIFSPNDVFSDYISQVLPEMGEENAPTVTFAGYAAGLLGSGLDLENYYEMLEYLLSARRTQKHRTRRTSIELKSSAGFLEVMRRFTREVKRNAFMFGDIYALGQRVAAAEELAVLFSKDYEMWPVHIRLQKIRGRLHYLLEPLREQRLEQIRKEQRKKDDSVLPTDDEIAEAKLNNILNSELRSVYEEIDRITGMNVVEFYSRLFKEEGLFRRLAAGTDCERFADGLDEIGRLTLQSLDAGQVNYEDIAPLLYLTCELGDRPGTGAVSQIIIDEIQDYSPIQLEVFRLIFADCGITMLGDADQSINPEAERAEFGKIAAMFPPGEAELVRLGKSYRSTMEIMEFCRGLLPDSARSNWEVVEREGEAPRVMRVKGAEALYEAARSAVESMRRNGRESIAVICRSMKGAQVALEALKPHFGDIQLVTDKDDVLKTGIVVIPSYLTKGLEFDAVVLVSAADDKFRENERNILYTACTRALHELCLCMEGDADAIIRNNPATTINR